MKLPIYSRAEIAAFKERAEKAEAEVARLKAHRDDPSFRCDQYGLPWPEFAGITFCRKDGARAAQAVLDQRNDARAEAEDFKQKLIEETAHCEAKSKALKEAQAAMLRIRAEERKRIAAFLRTRTVHQLGDFVTPEGVNAVIRHHASLIAVGAYNSLYTEEETKP